MEGLPLTNLKNLNVYFIIHCITRTVSELLDSSLDVVGAEMQQVLEVFTFENLLNLLTIYPCQQSACAYFCFIGYSVLNILSYRTFCMAFLDIKATFNNNFLPPHQKTLIKGLLKLYRRFLRRLSIQILASMKYCVVI